MSAHIVSYLSAGQDKKVNQELREIFFESSTRKNFDDEAQREAFFHKYLGWYLIHYPDYAWIALDKLDKKVLGYVVASPETDIPELLNLQPHLRVFEDYFNNFPAHLHINCHTDTRGMGLGRLLVETVIQELLSRKIRGLHIMTGVDARNKSFYARLGFDFESELKFQNSPILFMGKRLSEN